MQHVRFQMSDIASLWCCTIVDGPEKAAVHVSAVSCYAVVQLIHLPHELD